MKPLFHTRLLNDLFEDPCLYIRLLRERRAILFDLGFTQSLKPRDIIKITDVFVSHTHIDHFIGFDPVFRVLLRRDVPLRLYGPRDFTDHVEGKLKGYTWNLIADYPLRIEVYEIEDDFIEKTVFEAHGLFRRQCIGKEAFNGLVLREESFCIKAVILDHQIPCLGFSLEEDYHINIDKASLRRLGLSVGPWLGEFKRAIRLGIKDRVFTIGERDYGMEELMGIALITRGQKFTYIVDCLGSQENIKKAVGLAAGSDVLYCEASFLEADRERANDRYHLTARDAGRIAREAGVGRLVVFHFSPRYSDNYELLCREAEGQYGR